VSLAHRLVSNGWFAALHRHRPTRKAARDRIHSTEGFDVLGDRIVRRVRKWRPAAAAVLTTLLLLLFNQGASATDGGDAAATAEALFRAGRSAMKDNDFAIACPKFEESYRLQPAPGTVLNLAICQEGLGKLVEAWQQYHRALELLGATDDRVADTQYRLAELERRLPFLTIVLDPTAPPGARVIRDGVELGSAALGVPIPVASGPHRVVVAAPGHRPRAFEQHCAETERCQMLVNAGPPLPPPNLVPPQPAVPEKPRPANANVESSPATSTSERATSRQKAGYTLLGVGLAALATSAVAGAMVLKERAAVREDCDGKWCDSQAGVDAGTRGQRWVVVGASTLVVSIAGLSLGAWLVIDAPPASASAQHASLGDVRFDFSCTF
jgi:hypothetical protein